jgi:divalent metal cation (Fe/Co/Zn/Cd) transporter
MRQLWRPAHATVQADPGDPAVHIELPDELSLVEAHEIALYAKPSLRETFTSTDIVIHRVPASLGDRLER